jgi:CheY-specific phosphatase CheX
MHTQQLDPFLESAGLVLGMPVDTTTHSSGAVAPTDAQVIASVSISGRTPGTLSLSFPRSTAMRLAGLLAGRALAEDADDELADAIGEITDMIAGRAATAPHHRTPPTVTIRRGLLGARIPDAGAESVECCCAAGAFAIAFRPAPAEIGRVSPASAETSATRWS